MKRAAEVKPSVRCSEEPVAGDGSMCAVSITKRAKFEEPEAADGITRRSPKPLAADGAGIAKKRARKPEKSWKKEKGAEEKSKRSKKKRAEEKKIEEQVAGDGMKKEKRTKKPEGNEAMGEVADNEVIREEMMADNEASGVMKKKKKVVTWRLSQELLDYLRTKEVMGLLATEAPLPLWASKMGRALFDFNQTLKEDIAAEFQENREFNAHAHAHAHVLNQVHASYDSVRRG